MLAAPGPDNSAAGGQKRGGNAPAEGTESFTCTAYIVDRECRRLGYQSVLRQRRSGTEFVCVPALLENFSALLTLLAAGGSKRRHYVAPQPPMPPPQPPMPPPQPPIASAPCSICGSANSSNYTSTVDSGTGSRHGGWKGIFSRRSSSKAATAAATAAETAASAAAEAVASATAAAASVPSATQEQTDSKKEDAELHLQQLLANIRLGTERLVELAGLADAEDLRPSRPPPPPPLTDLQREVLYFQTRWPQLAEGLCAKLLEAGRTDRRLTDEVAARVKAEAGAKARCAIKVASMEAEVRRLRSELRRCGGRNGARQPPGVKGSQKPVQSRQQPQTKQPHVSTTLLPTSCDVETIGTERGDEVDEA